MWIFLVCEQTLDIELNVIGLIPKNIQLLLVGHVEFHKLDDEADARDRW